MPAEGSPPPDTFPTDPCQESLHASSTYAVSYRGVLFQLPRKQLRIKPEPLTFLLR